MQNLLDTDIKPEKIINIKHGKIAPPAVSLGAILFLIVGVIMVISLIWILMFLGIILIFISSIAAFGITGIQIDLENKKYRMYQGLLGLKRGKWLSFKNYPDMAIMSKHMKSSVSSRYGGAKISLDSLYFDICLLSKTHRTKVLIETTIDKNLAYKNVKKYAELMEVRLTTFKPVISEKTKSRKAATNAQRRR